MPEYLIEDEKTGRKWSYEGDQPPSVDEVDRIINYGQPGILTSVRDIATGFGRGAASGAIGMLRDFESGAETIAWLTGIGGEKEARRLERNVEELTKMQEEQAALSGGGLSSKLGAGAATIIPTIVAGYLSRNPAAMAEVYASGTGPIMATGARAVASKLPDFAKQSIAQATTLLTRGHSSLPNFVKQSIAQATTPDMLGMASVAGSQSALNTNYEAKRAYGKQNMEKVGTGEMTLEEAERDARLRAIPVAISSGLQTGVITGLFGPTGAEAIGGRQVLVQGTREAAEAAVRRATAAGATAEGIKLSGQVAANRFAAVEQAKALLASSIPKTFIKGATSEGLEEGLDQLSQVVLRKLTFNPELTLKQAVDEVIDAAVVGGILGGTVQVGARQIFKGQAKKLVEKEKLDAALAENAEVNDDSNIEKLLSSGQAVSFIANFGVNAEGLPVASPTFRSFEELKAFEAKAGIRHVPGSANPLFGLPAPFLDAQMLAAINILADPKSKATQARLDAEEFIKSRISQRGAAEQKDLFDTINRTVAKLNEAKILEAKEKEKGKLSSPYIEGKHKKMQEDSDTPAATAAATPAMQDVVDATQPTPTTPAATVATGQHPKLAGLNWARENIPWGERGTTAPELRHKTWTALRDAGFRNEVEAEEMSLGEKPFPTREQFEQSVDGNLTLDAMQLLSKVESELRDIGLNPREATLPKREDFKTAEEFWKAAYDIEGKMRATGASAFAGLVRTGQVAGFTKPVSPAATGATAQNQPWEMTKAEWRAKLWAEAQAEDAARGFKPLSTEDAKRFKPSAYYDVERAADAEHKASVEAADDAGKPVTAEVLAGYKGEEWADDALAKLTPAATGAKGEAWFVTEQRRLADSVAPEVQSKIEELSANRKTAKEIATELGLDVDQVRSVRNARKIPSLDEPAEFDAWLKARKPTPASTAAATPAMQDVVDAKKTLELENSLKDVKAESVAETLLEQKAPDAIDPEREALIQAYRARKALRQQAGRSKTSQSVMFPTLTQPSQTTTQTPSQPVQPAQPAQPVQRVGQVQSAQPVALSDVSRETLLPQPGAPKNKLRVWFAKTFDAARGLGSLAHYAIKQGATYVTQQGDIAKRLNSQMQSAIVNDLGKSELAQGSNALNALDAVLRGTANISILPQGMATVAKKMIAHRLETRNRLLSLPGNLLTPELRQSIIDNDDYLNRSYELFNNDKWVSELDSNKNIAKSLEIIVRDKIASFKRDNGKTITREEAINEIKAEMTSLRGDDVSVGSGIRRSSPGVTPGVSKFILGKRKNLADAYKVILGEEKDPRVNYINTVMKVAQLTSLHQTLTSVRDIAASRGLISKTSDMVKGHIVTLSESDAGKVFEGYRTSEEYAALLTEFTSAMENQGLFKTITTRLSRYAKLNQTAGQVQYTAMQILGNSYSILQSGRISTFLKIPGAAQVLLRKLAGTMTDADYARYSRMLGLNVVEDTPLDLQRDILSKVVYGDSSGLSALMFKFRGSSEKVMSFFKLVDNATKMAAFETELQTLTEAYPGSSSVELDKMAAIRTADKFPSYSNIPNYIKYITEKTPFAPFLNFFYLSNHNFVQSIRYGMLDLKNPKMRINGLKTLAGTAGALMAMDVIKATIQSALGDEITDDEEKVYRSGKQWYERHDDFLFYKKNGQVVGVNLSYANPLSHFRKVAKSIMASAENDDGIVEAGIMASKYLLAPLMSMDIFISSFLNAVRGSDENGKAVWLKFDESADKITKGIQHIASKVLIPLSIKRGFEKMIPAAEGEGKDKPYDASLKEQLVREFTSLKVERLNPKVALANQLRTFNGASSEIERNYFSKFLKEGQFYSEKDLLDKYRDMETRRRSLFKEGGKLVGNYVKSGLLEGVDPRRIARDTSVSELDMGILTGHLKYKPFVLGMQARQDLFKMNLQRKEKGLRPIVVPDAALTHRFD